MIDAAWLGAVLGVLFAARPPSAPDPRWTLLPSIARVDVEVMREHVVVTHEVTLPRGDYATGDLVMHVAWGATVPFAMDARILPVPDGQLTALPNERGEIVHVEQGRRAALPLVGGLDMAGVNVTLPQSLFLRALAPGNMALLRVRQLVRLPPPDAHGDRELLVRLGAANGNPLTLARIDVRRGQGAPEVSSVSARLCGKEADPLPLFVMRDPPPSDRDPREIAPVLSTRHASDDLCVRFKSP